MGDRCLWSESTFIFNLYTKTVERGDVHFQCMGEIHIDLNITCLTYCVVINWIFQEQQAYVKNNVSFECTHDAWTAGGLGELASCTELHTYRIIS